MSNNSTWPRQLPPEAQPYIAAAGRVLAEATARMNNMSPREIAEAAYTPGGPPLGVLEEMAKRRFRGESIKAQPEGLFEGLSSG